MERVNAFVAFVGFLASVATILAFLIALVVHWDVFCAWVPYATCKESAPSAPNDVAPSVGRTESAGRTLPTPAHTRDKSTKDARTDPTPPTRADDQIAPPPSAALPRRPTLESIPTPRHETNPAEPCIVVGSKIEAPVSVRVGSQICAKNGQSRATVHAISSYSVTYSVPGGRRVTCRRAELCSFDWDGAPLFNIDVRPGRGTSGRKAVLLNAR